MTSRREFLRRSIVASLATSAAARRALAVAPPTSPNPLLANGQAGPGAVGFFSDPFSAYKSYIADKTFTGTNGATTTVIWNGATLSAPTYSSVQAAVTAANGQPGTRVCLLAAQTWLQSATITIPNTGNCTDANRFVIQGDPAATFTPNTLPCLDMNNTNNIGIMIANGANNPYVTIRKIEMRNILGTSSGTNSLIRADQGGGGTFKGGVVEYCYMHDVHGSNGAIGESSTCYLNGNYGDGTLFTVRFCKLWRVHTTGDSFPFTGNDNYTGIGTYGGGLQIYNNDIGYCKYGIRFKGHAAAGTVKVYNNVFHDGYIGVGMVAAPDGGYVGYRIYNNLHYNQTQGFQGDNLNASNGQSTDNWIYGSTFAQDVANEAIKYNSITAVQFFDNVCLGNSPNITLGDPVSGCSTSLAYADYNAYTSNNGSAFKIREYSGEVDFANLSAWKAATGYPELPPAVDAHSVAIGSLAAPYNTVAGNMADAAYAISRNYALHAGSPLMTMSSTGGPIGYNSNNSGPGW